MSEERTLFKNMASMALAMLIPNALNLAFTMIAARLLSYNNFNDFNIVINFVTMFALMSDFGLNAIVIREVSKDHGKADKFFSTLIPLKLLSITITTAIGLVALHFMSYSGQTVTYIYIAMASLYLFQAAQAFAIMFQALERMEYVTYCTVLQVLTYVVFGLLFLWRGMAVEGLIYANLLSNIAIFLGFAYFAATRIPGLKVGFDRGTAKYILLAGLPFAINILFFSIYNYADKVLLSIMKAADVANYTQPYNLVMALSFVALAYNASAFPLFSKLTLRGKDSLRYACERSFKYLIMLVLPMCVGITLLADRIVYAYITGKFAGSILVLQILVWYLLFMAVSSVTGTLINATYRERLGLYTIALCTVADLALNVLLIPAYGAVGSSIAMVIAIGALNAAITLYIIREDIKGLRLFGSLARAVVSSAAMAAAILLVNLNNLFLYVAMGVAIYFLTYALTGGFTREDLELFKKIFSFKKAIEIKES